MTHRIYQLSCQKIISGGQSGVDRGALDACIAENFNYGGWCPKGRIAEDGILPIKYCLKETQSAEYIFRTKKNIEESDATLIITKPKLIGGTLATKNYAQLIKKPVFILSSDFENGLWLKEFLYWLEINNVIVLNIAGPRISEWPDAYRISFKITQQIIYQITNSLF